MSAPNNTPNPGSPEAVEQGCTCPVWDNCRGAGYMRQPGVFVMHANCPLHGAKAKEAITKGRQ